MFAVLVR